MKKDKSKKIKAFWDEEARKKGASLYATIPDFYLKQIEIKSILTHVKDGNNVLDIGCGNGYSSISFAKNRKINITGVDFSSEMIKAAKEALNKTPELKKKVNFSEGDVTKIAFDKKNNNFFDIVITERCLINLVDFKAQIKALNQICLTLKKRGMYLMCEDTQNGLRKLNKLRTKFNLPEIKNRWHNVYINEKLFLKKASKLFDVLAVENISSTYYIVSRIINARIAADEKKEPDYLSPINRIGSELPILGDFGPLKLFIFQKN